MAFKEFILSSDCYSMAMDERRLREDRIGFVPSEDINRDTTMESVDDVSNRRVMRSDDLYLLRTRVFGCEFEESPDLHTRTSARNGERPGSARPVKVILRQVQSVCNGC
jgi:hypothetical protein